MSFIVVVDGPGPADIVTLSVADEAFGAGLSRLAFSINANNRLELLIRDDDRDDARVDVRAGSAVVFGEPFTVALIIGGGTASLLARGGVGSVDLLDLPFDLRPSSVFVVGGDETLDNSFLSGRVDELRITRGPRANGGRELAAMSRSFVTVVEERAP